MVQLKSLVMALAPLAATVAHGASWSFKDGSVSVQGKGVGVDGSFTKEKLSASSPLTTAVSLGPINTLRVVLTTTEDDETKRPHQAFLTLREPASGLEDSFPFSIKENGKGKVEITHKDLPSQFLASELPITASIVLGSFGSATPFKGAAFDIAIKRDASAAAAQPPAAPTRYGKREPINHIFRTDPTSPPKIITLIFTAAVLAALPVLLIGWLSLGANLNHLSEALGSAPVSHTVFFGSLVLMEGIFFMYYSSWNLFQTLPAAAVVGSVAFFSGTRALSEVQGRRLAGKR